jgi:hypothetical protein
MGIPNSIDASVPLDEQAVRAKAHQLWVDRGCPIGSAEADWYEAERLLREATSMPSVPTQPAASSKPRRATTSRKSPDKAKRESKPAPSRAKPRTRASKR